MTTMVGLYVEYKAKTDQIDRALGKLQSELDQVKDKQTQVGNNFNSMSSRMSSGLDKILSHWKAIVSVIAAHQLISSFNHIADSIDSVTDSARALGLSAESFKSITYAASLSGLGVEQTTMAIGKMNLTLGQAINGDEGAVGALKQLKLNINDLKGLSADEQFKAIANGLASISDKQQQAAAAFAIFGKSYKEVLGAIRDGVADNIGELKKLGLELTDTQRKAVDSFGDSKLKLGAIWEGFSEKIVANVAPAFTKIIDFISDTIVKMGGIDAVADKFSKAIITGVEIAIRAMNGLLNTLDNIYNRMLKMQIFALEQTQNFGDPGTLAVKGGAAITNALFGTNFQVGQTDEQKDRAARINKLYEDLSASEKQTEARKDWLKPLADQVKTEGDKIGKSFQSISDSSNKASNNLTKAADQFIIAGDKVSGMIKSKLDSSKDERLNSILDKVKVPGLGDTYNNDAFDKLGARIVQDLQDGFDPNSARVQSGFATLNNWAQSSGNLGQKGAAEEINNYIRGLGGKNQNVNVKIDVTPNENFWIKWGTDQNTARVIDERITEISAQAAGQSAK